MYSIVNYFSGNFRGTPSFAGRFAGYSPQGHVLDCCMSLGLAPTLNHSPIQFPPWLCPAPVFTVGFPISTKIPRAAPFPDERRRNLTANHRKMSSREFAL